MLLFAATLVLSDPDTVIEVYRARTAAERPCVRDLESTDITVCGMRNADRFRVPFEVHDPGDPRHESVSEERNRLLHRTRPIDDRGPFLIGGGMAGVTFTADSDGQTKVRKPAP